MFNGLFHIPKPANEPGLSYAPGSPERAELQATLQSMIDNPVEVPIMIGGEEVHSDTLVEMDCPHDLSQKLGTYHQANTFHANQAIDAAKEIGAKGTLASAHLDLGKLHKAKGRNELAREHILEAVRLFEECEAQVFLEQAKNELP